MTSKTNSGDFVLEVANLGKDVVTSFTKFITSRKVQERHLETILASVSITTSILLDLGTTINQHEKHVNIADEVTRPTCETCRVDFEKLLVLSKEASESGMWIREGTLGGKPVAAEIDPWFLFNIGLGGREKAAEFWKRMEATRYNLVTISDTLKYKIFKELKDQNRLNPEQAADLKSLTSLLPQLIKSIETIERIEAEKKERLQSEKAAMLKKDADLHPKKLDDAASEVTMIEANADPIDVKIRRHNTRNDEIPVDRRSIYSFDSFDNERNANNDINEIYEEWLLRWTEPRHELRTSWGMLGFKIKEYYEDPGVWSLDPELRSQEELKTAYEALSTFEAKHRESVNKAMRGLPKKARSSIKTLVEDRERSSSNAKARRQWSIVAVRPKIKDHYGGLSFFKSAKSQDWLIMLKGETVDKAERKYPYRFEDPWRNNFQPVPRRRSPRRSCPPPRPVSYNSWDHDYIPPQRVRHHSPVRVRSQSPLPFIPMEDHRHRQISGSSEIEGFRPGTIVVGEVLNIEDAEKKMDEILQDLPAKFSSL